MFALRLMCKGVMVSPIGPTSCSKPLAFLQSSRAIHFSQTKNWWSDHLLFCNLIWDPLSFNHHFVISCLNKKIRIVLFSYWITLYQDNVKLSDFSNRFISTICCTTCIWTRQNQHLSSIQIVVLIDKRTYQIHDSKWNWDCHNLKQSQTTYISFLLFSKWITFMFLIV